jgi:hypothetical protein
VQGSFVDRGARTLIRACAILIFLFALLAALVAAGFADAAARGPADPWLNGPRQPHARLSGPITAVTAATLHPAWRIATKEPVSSAPIVGAPPGLLHGPGRYGLRRRRAHGPRDLALVAEQRRAVRLRRHEHPPGRRRHARRDGLQAFAIAP